MKRSFLIISLSLLALAAGSLAQFNTASLFMLDARLKPIMQPYRNKVAIRFIDLETDREMLVNLKLISNLDLSGSREAEGIFSYVSTVESTAGNYYLAVQTQGITQETEARSLIAKIAVAVYDVYTYSPPIASIESQTR